VRRWRKERTRTVLVASAVGLFLLIALPGIGRYRPPEGALPGRVLGPDARPVRECRVALFDAESLELVEVAHTDRQGRFAFRRAPAASHVFADPAPSTGLLGSWLLDTTDLSTEEASFSLERGRLAHLEVLDPEGGPAPDVEVRAYRAGPEPRLLVRARTDAKGRARLVVPARAHLAAIPAEAGRLPAWLFDRTTATSGSTHLLELREGRVLEGRVVLDDGRSVDRALVSSWDRVDGSWLFNGYALTDEAGHFTLGGRGEGTELRAVAPERVALPARRVLRGGDEPQELVLRHGLPLELFVADVAQRGRPARVWFWSEDANAWSWGIRTDEEGRVLTSVSELFSVVAEPVSEGALPSEAWDRVYEGPRLKLAPGSTGR